MITKQVKLVDVPEWSLILYQDQILQLEKVEGPARSDGQYHAFIHRLDKETIPARLIGGTPDTLITIFVKE